MADNRVEDTRMSAARDRRRRGKGAAAGAGQDGGHDKVPHRLPVDAPFRDGLHRRRPGLLARLNASLERHFVDREIFVRGNDRVRYLRISARVQKVGAVAGTALLFWIAIATLGVGLQQNLLARHEAKIEAQQVAYLDLMTEVSDYHAAFDRITADLEENQRYLLEILQADGIAPDKLAGIEEGLKSPQQAEDRIALARDSLRTRLKDFETDLKNIAQRNESLQAQVAALRATLHASEAERAEIADVRNRLDMRLMTTEARLADAQAANDELSQVIEGLRLAVADRDTRIAELSQLRDLLKADVVNLNERIDLSKAREANLHREIGDLNRLLRTAIARGDHLDGERQRMAAQLVGAFRQMGEMRDAQHALLERLDQRTARTVDALQQALAMTGIELEPVLAELEADIRAERLASLGGIPGSVGGPFLPVGLAGPPDPHADRLEVAYSLLDQRLDRWDAVKALFEVVPVAAPMREYRLTSGFGTRKDPMNGKPARHEGIDLVGPWRAPILATAPGVVTFAGWKGAYGRMVEVDHGYGFKTRYAHLRNFEVKEGDVVSFGQEIGEMGNSGRSTGAHLHYEILFQDRPYDPANFLKAGRHVFKS